MWYFAPSTASRESTVPIAVMENQAPFALIGLASACLKTRVTTCRNSFAEHRSSFS
jgi:hypothetical protein